jgi:3-oxoacyl-[acyl-carrier-protein] synthase III
MIIESLGVYLPERLLTTAEMLKACRRVPLLPFQRLTGIERRPVASPTEFSIDLARQALRRCLALSRRSVNSIDLLICCNISRRDGPNHRMSIEPTTASRLRAEFGLSSADAFDVSNACAGTFTGLLLARIAFATGVAKRALIVSGEHITHLATTAQQEIDSLADPRLACLTLGDSGVAILVESDGSPDVGFHDLDLFTLGEYSGLCTGLLTDRPHGGAIMLTQSRQLTEAALEHCVPHGPALMKKHDWDPDRIDAFITHQTAKLALDKARAELNRHLRRTWLREDNFVSNVRDRGNLATNSHFVALYDRARQGQLCRGHRVVFSIAASGLTGGSALYTLDDLPDRLRQHRNGRDSIATAPAAHTPPRCWSPKSTIRVASVGTTEVTHQTSGAVEMARAAAVDCLARADRNPQDIDVLIYCGIYRDRLLSEPALASILAGQLGLDSVESSRRYSKLAFDISDGAVGFLKGCHCAAQLIDAGRAQRVLVVTAERQGDPAVSLHGAEPVAPAASAALLERSDAAQEGFRLFAFQTFTEQRALRTSYCVRTNGSIHLIAEQDATFAQVADGAAAEVVRHVAASSTQQVGFQWLLLLGDCGPRLGSVAREIGLAPDRVIVPQSESGELFTSSFVHAFQTLERSPNRRPGDHLLVIQVGSGMRVVCALYHL